MTLRLTATAAVVAALLIVPTAPARAAVEVDILVTGLDHPWSVAFTEAGRAFVSERDAGVVSEVVDGQAREVHRFEVDPAGEGGLLGLAASPDFADDGWLYAYLTTPSDNRIVRFRPGGAVEVLLAGIPSATIHNGGRIRFGPDGMLYAGTGDAADSGLAQEHDSLAGKVLRIAPDGSIPDGNPFPGSPVWTVGHRNVQGLAWDAAGRMFATELGPDRDDEINHIRARRNYGWPRVTGDADDPRYTDAIFVRQPPDASWSGASVLRSGHIPEWDGDLLVAALRGQRLWHISLDGAQVTGSESLYTGDHGRLRDVVEAPDGSVWLLTGNGDGQDRILRLHAPRDPRISAACPEAEIDDAGFSDVGAGNVHGDAIDCVAHYGITSGVDDDHFVPDRAVTRAEAASLTARMLAVAGFDLPPPDGDSFDDVDPDSPHAVAIDQLDQLEVLRGYSASTFAPLDPLSRAQATTVLVRAYETLTGEPLPDGGDAFSDDDGSVHEDDIDTAAEAGIANGRGSGRFAPSADVARDGMASFVARTLDVAVVRAGVEPQPR